MTLLAPDRTVLLRAGQGAHVPSGQPHWVRNDGDRELRFLLASSPRASGDRICVDTADWRAAAP
jgi:mannose-6-phosphate isomerase-like protein (cupin superfamily)